MRRTTSVHRNLLAITLRGRSEDATNHLHDFRCAAAGFGNYGFEVTVEESEDEYTEIIARAFAGFVTLPYAQDVVNVQGLARCTDPEPDPPVHLDAAVVCEHHEPYGGYPSTLDWVIDLLFDHGGPAQGSLHVGGMNGDEPLVFDIPVPGSGGPVRHPVRGGITSYGPKPLESFIIVANGETIDLTDELRAIAGGTYNVTGTDGRIGGSGTCP